MNEILVLYFILMYIFLYKIINFKRIEFRVNNDWWKIISNILFCIFICIYMLKFDNLFNIIEILFFKYCLIDIRLNIIRL